MEKAVQIHSRSNDQFDRFFSLLDQYAFFLAQAQKPVRRSPKEKAAALFLALADDRRQRLISRLETDVAIFQEVLAAGEHLTDSRRLLWRYFVKKGGSPCSDLFGLIGDQDVVEVYSLDQTHLFQNLHFFDWVSVTIEQVFCQTWFEMTKRDLKFQQLIYAAAGRILSGEVRQTLLTEVPFHLVEEIDTEMNFKFYLRQKYLSPVFIDGRLQSIVAVSECKPHI
jgi:hypothetical protein